MSANRLLRALLFLAPIAACAALYLASLSGAFLSDDYAVLAALDAWHREGRLGAALVSKFVSGLDAPSNYYRPLSMLSFAANFMLSGAEPDAWRLTNLVIHLASGALLFAIAQRLVDARGGTEAPWAATVAATVFLLFPVSAEAVAWVSGRYDLLAVFFSLLSVACFQRMTRWNDHWGWASLAAAPCGFASKESALLVPVFVTALAMARHPATPRGALHALVEASPWLALTAAYFVLRAAVFGNPFQVYAGSAPIDTVLHGDWLHALSSVPEWLDAALAPPSARIAFLTASAALIAVSAARSATHRTMPQWLAVAATALLSVALLLPHVSALAATGEQGRLFYAGSALFSLLIAFALLPPRPRLSARFHTATAVAVALLIGAEVVLLQGNIAQWAHAGRQARMLIVDLPRLAQEVPPGGYGFVLVPDHIGSVPFARNAQGGLVLPPSQPVPLSMRLIVQTPVDLAAWPGNIRRGLVDALRRFPLEEVWVALGSGKAVEPVTPSNYYCWDATEGRIEAIALPPVVDDSQWLDAWKSALATGPCRALGAELTAR